MMFLDKEEQEAQEDQDQDQNQEAAKNGCRRIPGACPLGVKRVLEPKVTDLKCALLACL